MSQVLQPVAEGDRIDLLDALRGFALLGILLVNFWGNDEGTRFAALDSFTSSALEILISNSFYPLFSFLFGLGFAVQLMRARSRGSGSSLLFFRRLLALFLIGTVHVVLIWDGDILVSYAILGLALIPLHRVPQKGIMVLAGALYIASLNGGAIRTWAAASSAPSRELTNGARDVADRIVANRRWRAEDDNGSYRAEVGRRWGLHMRDIRNHGHWAAWATSDILLFFLIGLLVGRSRVLHEAGARRRPFIIAASIATVLGVGGAIAYHASWLDAIPIVERVGWDLANPGLTAFYVLAITLAFTFTDRGRRAFGVFVAPGRMALTIYLMQSVVMTLLSHSYGFGWTPSATVWVAINLVFFFGVQIPFSKWWLARFRYGPAEWLWRSLTYGSAQPFRI